MSFYFELSKKAVREEARLPSDGGENWNFTRP